MERVSPGQPDQPDRIIPLLNAQTVEGLLGANATRHVLYLLEGQYLYQSQGEDGSIRYKFLSPQSVRLAFSQEPVDSGWLPPELCRWGYGPSGAWAVMFVPPAKHSLWLPSVVVSSEGNEARPGEIQAANREGELTAVEVTLPGLVFAGVGQNYYLWAVKEDTFTPEALAFHAPLPNVYGDGRICWGSNRVESATAQNLPAAWKLFISSPFNLHLVGGKSKRHPQTVLEEVREIASSPSGHKSRRRRFPLRDLVPLKNNWEREGLTVGGLVERLISAANSKAGW